MAASHKLLVPLGPTDVRIIMIPCRRRFLRRRRRALAGCLAHHGHDAAAGIRERRHLPPICTSVRRGARDTTRAVRRRGEMDGEMGGGD